MYSFQVISRADLERQPVSEEDIYELKPAVPRLNNWPMVEYLGKYTHY